MPAAHPLAARSSGVLLHPTSLPGPYGIGDLGPAARAWVDALASAGQAWWQVLPLGPTGYGDSPYQCFSAFAGNPNLLSPDDLMADGLIPPDTLADFELPAGPVDYERVTANKRELVERAWKSVLDGNAPDQVGQDWQAFERENATWLDEFGLFLALKDAHGGESWLRWPAPIRLREPAAMEVVGSGYLIDSEIHGFAQFLFYRQWDRLRAYAHSKGVRLIGDMPIFLAEDSADVWANPELFRLDADRRPVAVAGVPPDYFSATGQLWGNPLYDWPAHDRTNFAWWTARLRAATRQVDLIRLDHFRGFEAYWEVPAGSPTAENGRWVKGPGERLLTALHDSLGGLPLIAEDLGVITPPVDALRTRFGLPGMRILQFAFGGAVEDRFLPHNYENPTVAYTGTHDNDTTAGWFAALTPEEMRRTRAYLGYDGDDVAGAMVREAWKSVATLAVAPAQDLIGVGTEARMNYPGRPSGNWRWRMDGPLPDAAVGRLGEWTALYGRTPSETRNP